jgi:hypothetical protein
MSEQSSIIAPPWSWKYMDFAGTSGARPKRNYDVALPLGRVDPEACGRRSTVSDCDECGSATSPITRDPVTPQGVTAAWWPLRCKFGSAGAGAESPLSRLQFPRSQLAPRASGWLDPAVDPEPRPSAEMRVVARTRDATPTTTGDLHRCLRRYGPCLAPDGSPSSGAGSSVFGSDVAASAVSAVARGATTPFSAGSTGAESAVQLLA